MKLYNRISKWSTYDNPNEIRDSENMLRVSRFQKYTELEYWNSYYFCTIEGFQYPVLKQESCNAAGLDPGSEDPHSWKSRSADYGL